MTMQPMDTAAAITPVVLTWNEAPNIARCLASLTWATRVVVVDSGSTDNTEALARAFPNVSWFVRPFDTHARQWSFGVHETGITTPYVLALDADYAVPAAFAQECADRFLPGGYDGGVAGFEYRVLGRALIGSVYPAKPVVFRPSRLRIEQPGHTQDVHVDGPLYTFTSRLIHEDRKALERFTSSQLAYARLEDARLASGGARRWQDRARLTGLMPLVAGLAAWLRAGGPLRGRSALRYTYERVLFECLLAMHVMDREAEPRDSAPAVARQAGESGTNPPRPGQP
jgi:hypothetical protein